MRPSLPITTLWPLPDRNSQVPKADVNRTISNGVRPDPGFPPMVPLMPEMLLINATRSVSVCKLNHKSPKRIARSTTATALTSCQQAPKVGISVCFL